MHIAGSRSTEKDRHIATVMAGIRNSHARPPVQKEAVMAEDIIAMIETLDRGTLRGLRDRAMLLIGYADGLRRSEIVGLDLKADQTEDGRGWIEILGRKGRPSQSCGRKSGRNPQPHAGDGAPDATALTQPALSSLLWISGWRGVALATQRATLEEGPAEISMLARQFF
jgi:hypothetical protein